MRVSKARQIRLDEENRLEKEFQANKYKLIFDLLVKMTVSKYVNNVIVNNDKLIVCYQYSQPNCMCSSWDIKDIIDGDGSGLCIRLNTRMDFEQGEYCFFNFVKWMDERHAEELKQKNLKAFALAKLTEEEKKALGVGEYKA